ncbi:MAG TPA: DUF72 domain-containing protein [Polyangiaceae bacterium]|nr:DUF72 domain-containing protein [Polyangiaceae bacterium]
MIKVGLCGFTMAMAKYPLHFSVVEVQQTFYEPPSESVMQRWCDAMPSGFEFTLKAWQLITHESKSPTYRRLRRPLDAAERAGCGAFRDSPIVRSALARTLDCVRSLQATAVLFQSPASFRPDAENVARMRRFFGDIANPERPAGVRYLWEPRGAPWTAKADLAVALCQELGLGYVVDPFVDEVRQSADGPAYLRLHGVTGARHVYTDEELERLARLTPANAYVMFNNMPRVGDAKRFLALLQARSAP